MIFSPKPLNECLLENVRKVSQDSEVTEIFENMLNPEKGIELPSYLLVQQRIVHAQSSLLYSFFPNRIVTNQMFNRIVDPDSGNLLLHGRAGISKTGAIIMYCYLSKIINDFRIKSSVENP